MRERLDGTVPLVPEHDDEWVGGPGYEKATDEATVEVWMLLDGRDGVRVRMERKGLLSMGDALTAARGLVPAARGVARRMVLERGCRNGRI
jgi:hypothetical protein